jgi:hypothetical protein
MFVLTEVFTHYIVINKGTTLPLIIHCVCNDVSSLDYRAPIGRTDSE